MARQLPLSASLWSAAFAMLVGCTSSSNLQAEETHGTERKVAGTGPVVEEDDRQPSLGTGSRGRPYLVADCPSWANLDPRLLPALPASPYRESFSTVWRTLLKKHFDPTLDCLDWPRVREDYGRAIAEADTVEDAYRQINAMLMLLGQSHLIALPPVGLAGGEQVLERGRGGGLLPLRVRWIEDRLIVVEDTQDGLHSEIPRGAELIRVRKNSMRSMIKRVRKAHGGVQGSPSSTARALAQGAGTHLTCMPGEKIEVVYRPLGGEKRSAVVPCRKPRGDRVSLGNLHDIVTRVRWSMLGDAEEKVGYLTFNFWMVPMLARVREGLATLREQGMRALVLDLRGNPGGVAAMAIPVGRLLLPEGGSLGTLHMRNMKQELTVLVEPGGQAFAGPVAILVDEGSASTTEIFATGMRDLGRVSIFAGGPSAGMALPSLIEILPDSGRLQYVVGEYRSPKGSRAEGAGVVVDRRVDETREAIASGKDPVLDEAFDVLKHRLSMEPK